MHQTALKRLSAILYSRGIKFKLQPISGIDAKDGCDIIVNGKTCELKTGVARREWDANLPAWKFNIHRHGKLGKPAKIYAFYCPLTGSRGIWLFVPYPEIKGRLVVQMTVRSIAMRWGKWINRYDLFA